CACAHSLASSFSSVLVFRLFPSFCSPSSFCFSSFFFFFNDTAPPEIYTLSLHDALPISIPFPTAAARRPRSRIRRPRRPARARRSEEHTSELQSRRDLVCRLLLEKKKKK